MAIGKFVKNSGIYTVVTFLQKGLAFILLPLYTSYLTPADYGVMNIVTSISALLSLLFLLGLNSAAARFYYNDTTNTPYIKRLWGAVALCVIINSIIIGTVFIVFHEYILDPLVGKVQFFPFLLLGCLTTIVSPLYMLYQTYLQTRQESLHYGLNTLCNFLINVGLIILFVVVLEKGVVGVLLAHLITAIIFFIYVTIFFLPKIQLNLDKEIIKPAYKYSLPLVPHLLAGWSTGLIDRLLINGLRNESETGLYSVSKQFGDVILTIANSFNMAFSPWLYESYNNKQFSDIRNAGMLAILVYTFLALGLSLFAPEILRIMVSSDFRGVWNIISIIAFAMVFNGLYFLFVDVLFINKTNYVFIVSVSALVINIVLNLLLIPKMGIIGSAIACYVSYGVKSIIALILYKKSNKEIKYNWPLMYIIPLIAFSFTFVNYPLQSMPLSLAVLFKLIIVFAAGLYISLKYKNQLIAIISKIKKR